MASLWGRSGFERINSPVSEIRKSNERLAQRLLRFVPPNRTFRLEECVNRLLQVLAALVIGTAFVGVTSSGAAEPVMKKAPTAGFYRGEVIHYFDFGPIKLKAGNKLAPLWTVTNGPTGQHN